MRGARAFGVLLRNEWFKARKRLAFWIALGFYAFFTLMNHAQPFLERGEGFRLPSIWVSVFGDESTMVVIFAALTLVLLSATEFGWRTARQNVIDGLSKSQWFWGKSLLLPVVGLAFIGVHVLIPTVLALIRTDFGAAEGPLVPLSVFQAAGGLGLAFLSVGALAFLLSLVIRKTGAALAVWFLWIGPIESGMLPALVRRFLPDHAGWLDYLPFSNTFPLLEFRHYDAAAYERYAAAVEAAGRTPSAAVDPAWHLVTAAAWTALLVGIAYISFRRRDL
ncbi:MAG: hypothetical protein OXT63_12660 [Gemmatimonadota bacterium]|uniref:hypothetical protein n=1 Tax=Candidatus Palauibacter soopunensis TaxID=3056739 RepID=UPI002384F63A|nr:hypothetical protein [Candidatus Palauibacter soopunensis]MDE2879907.1 hypothetical protein [Candidatus Palauibacter soopunensis]MDE2945039.1 hypothetical protein [Gemmatimonadota bacterium]